jgi:ATP-dependent RNA helicase SUPV3L1/SUV3
LMKPGAAQWRMVLLALKQDRPLVQLPQAGLVLIADASSVDEIGAGIAGFRKLGDVLLRIDMVERIARGAHEAIAAGKPYGMDDATIVSIGLPEAAFLELMRQAGFRPIEAAAEGAPNWQFKGRPRARLRPERRPQRQQPAGEQAAGARAERQARPDRPRGKQDDRPRKPKDGEAKRPARPPRDERPAPRRDNAPSGNRAGQMVATGKALAGLAALLGREE